MKKYISFLFFLSVIGLTNGQNPYQSYYQDYQDFQGTNQNQYDPITNGKNIETYKSNFLTLHKTNGKVYVELPVKELPEDVLIGASIASISDPNIAIIGMKSNKPLHFQFEKKGEKIIMKLIESELINQNKNNPTLEKVIEKSFKNPSVFSYNIVAYNKDLTSVIFDMTSFFMQENTFFPTFDRRDNPNIGNSHYQGQTSYIYQVKAFEKNAVIKVEKNYKIGQGNAFSGNSKTEPATVRVAFTIMKLPKKAMTPRASDTRVGVFQTEKLLFDKDNNILPVTFVRRWRLEPLDIKSFKEGKLTEPKKKIVFYIDDAFPTAWVEPIEKGILRWNKAFEKIGFKNVIEVKPFPKDDPNFDPDNLEYSCIRYVPQLVENAVGPSWIDPRTGEIINGTVFVFSNVSNLINRWRLVQTGQVDERARKKEISKDLFDETLSYVVAHEFGHTLGFAHAMKSSSSFAVDSLRSREFTQKYGTAPSIMDYARFNYVAQPEDKGVSLSPPLLGVYDDFLVDWTYRYFPELNGDFQKEAEALKRMVDEKEGNPHYQYIAQQKGLRLDPSAIEEDLGNNPQKASDYGLKNLKFVLDHFENWITDDEDSSYKMKIYDDIANQALIYARNVSMNIGGVYLFQTSEKSELPRYKVIDKERQRASTLWLLDKAKHISSFAKEDLEQKFYATTRPFEQLAQSIRTMAVNNIMRVSFSSYLDENSYTPLEYCEDVFQSVFEKTLKGEEDLTPDEMALQTTYVDFLIKNTKLALEKKGSNFAFTTETNFHREHFCLHNNDVKIANPNFGEKDGAINDLLIQSADKTDIYSLLFTEQAMNLLDKVRKNTQNPDLKLHYNFLYRKLRFALEGK